MPDLRQIIEDPSYRDAFAALGDPTQLDEALEAIVWSLATKPEEWPIVPGFITIRRAKTDMRPGSATIPRVRVWFRIDESGEHVHLLYIEREPQDEGGPI